MPYYSHLVAQPRSVLTHTRTGLSAAQHSTELKVLKSSLNSNTAKLTVEAAVSRYKMVMKAVVCAAFDWCRRELVLAIAVDHSVFRRAIRKSQSCRKLYLLLLRQGHGRRVARAK